MPLHRSTRVPAIGSAFLILAFAAAASTAAAQRIPSELPAERRVPVEAPQGPLVDREPSYKLPASSEVLADSSPIVSLRGIQVDRIELVGSTVFDRARVHSIVSPYEGREVGARQLRDLARELTRLYEDEGFLHSAVVLPDQEVAGGVVRLQAVESRLVGIEIPTLAAFPSDYWQRRIERKAGAPLNLENLNEALQMMIDDARIESISADLVRAERPGEFVLEIDVREAGLLAGSIGYDNYLSARLGGHEVIAHAKLLSATGNADPIGLMYRHGSGLDDVELEYEVPIWGSDVSLGLRGRYSKSEIVTEPFDALEIKGTSLIGAVSLQGPLIRTRRDRLDLRVEFAYRYNSARFLDDQPFFTEESGGGRTRAAIVRFSQEYLHREPDLVIGLFSTLSAGLPILNSTNNPNSIPDARFLAWLGQAQWAQRWTPTITSVLRGNVQLSEGPVLSIERFSVGGVHSVRGYRENEFVRDSGWTASAELSWQFMQGDFYGLSASIAPFFDIGQGWDLERNEPSPGLLYSAGLALRGRLGRHWSFGAAWAHGFVNLDRNEGYDLQNSGVHLEARWEF